jgi:penicillin-binding protein 2
VAGKTGTAQATDRGHESNIAWFACFAPFDNPKYVVVVMVQAGEHSGHGGSVAGPIAARIMERTLAMDEGNFDMQVAWVPPAHKPNPFQTVKSVSYGTGGNLGGDDEEEQDSSGANVQMAGAGGEPDVEPEADAQGKVARQRAPRAVPVVQPQRQPSFFERLFGARRQPQPQPAAPPRRSSR